MLKYSLITICLLSSNANSNTLIVEAFYDADTRIINIQMAERVATVITYDLSAPERFEEALSEGLSSDPAVAEKQARQRISQRGNEIQQQLMAAYEGSLKAMQYKIDKLPAVVFNSGEHVIYGVNDVNKAITIFNEQVARK